VFAVLGWARAQSVEDQLKKLEQERAEAVIKGNTDLVAKQTSDDYMYINVNGAIADKAQMLDQIKSGKIKLESDELSDLKVRMYGNTAVMTGKSAVKGVVGGKDTSGTIAFTRVWVKKGGKWQTVAFQQTKVE
jgi:ketosteroid isomerase-like protein